MKQKTYEQLEKSVKFYQVISVLLVLIASSLAWYANGLRVDNVAKNKKVCELKCYKQTWDDFNKSYIPGTALPRLPEIEAIYEGR